MRVQVSAWMRGLIGKEQLNLPISADRTGGPARLSSLTPGHENRPQ